jgi:peptidoglycan hydrolase CwlO-like protein
LFVCAEIATLEEGNADLEVGRGNFESQYALMVKQLARKDAELEAEEKERDDLEATLKKENADLEKEKAALEATLEKEKADLEADRGPRAQARAQTRPQRKLRPTIYTEELQENMGNAVGYSK